VFLSSLGVLSTQTDWGQGPQHDAVEPSRTLEALCGATSCRSNGITDTATSGTADHASDAPINPSSSSTLWNAASPNATNVSTAGQLPSHGLSTAPTIPTSAFQLP